MGFNVNGYFLRPARFASGNAASTGEATSGVSRDHLDLSLLGYQAAPSGQVEPYADMYRASTLLRPNSEEQYIIWVATTSSFKQLETDAFILDGGPDNVSALSGSLSVSNTVPPNTPYEDGTNSLLMRDGGGRDLGYVKTILVFRADTQTKILIVRNPGAGLPGIDEAASDYLAGRVVLDSQALSDLGGGFSVERGDRVLSWTYVLSAPKFWWSKNDAQLTRFYWNGIRSQWEPLPGGSPFNLGSADPEKGSYTLSPPPKRFSAGDELPYDGSSTDSYALVRAGVYPDSASTPLQILCVADSDTENYPGVGAAYDAVVGETNGVLLLNPAWAQINAGLTLWYNPESFSPEAEGYLADLADLSLGDNFNHPVLAPLPGPTDRPFVRLGNRRHLTPVPKDDDASLSLPAAISEGQFEWSRTTGKISFSAADIRKASPGEAGYDKAYLGAQIYYDGVALNQLPMPIREPTPIVDSSGTELDGLGDPPNGIPLTGDLFIQRAVSMPAPGKSGVLWIPDGSGDAPAPSAANPPKTRPNGSGLKRQVEGFGDSFLFTRDRSFETLVVEEYEKDIPALKFKIKKSEAVTSRLQSDTAPSSSYLSAESRVQIRRRGLKGEPLYYVQTEVTPCVYSTEPRLYSRYRGKYALQGTESLTFYLQDTAGTTYTWLASTLGAGDWTAQEVADSINALIAGGEGEALAIQGRLVLSATQAAEIGWNPDPEDFSGHAALGLLPGWRSEPGTDFVWQPDSGAAFGLYRSPENADSSLAKPDIRSISQVNQVVTDSITSAPTFQILNPPLEDVPGFDDGVHFRVSAGLKIIDLKNWGIQGGLGVKYDWPNQQFFWTKVGETSDTPILSPTSNLIFQDPSVFAVTLDSEAFPNSSKNFGLYLKEVGSPSSQELTLDETFAIGGGGEIGPVAILIEKEGVQTFQGGSGVATSPAQFTNPVFSGGTPLNNALQQEFFNSVEVGYLLEVLSGPNKGVYTITDKRLAPSLPLGIDVTTLEVTPEFPSEDSGFSWLTFEAQLPDVYDPALLADIQTQPLIHFPEEPWQIRVLSPIGKVGSLENAFVDEALRFSRVVQVRFGLDQPPNDNSASITYLVKGVGLGTAVSSGLSLPDLSDPHFTESTVGGDAYFQLRIGTTAYNTSSSNLAVVLAFTGDPDFVEVGAVGSPVEGEVGIGSNILAAGAGEQVYYDQLFRAPGALSASSAEVDPATGAVNLSAADEASYAGEAAYFVEQLRIASYDGDLADVKASPLNGSAYFYTPLREFQFVETEYWQADTSGDKLTDDDGNSLPKIVEYLPLITRLETATRVDSTTYTFNPTGRTLLRVGEESIWAGAELQNYGGETTATVDSDTSTIRFLSSVDSTDEVRLNYAYLEAYGGEQTFTVSSGPVYRKPFFLEKGQSSFTLEEDRTDDVLVGQMLLVGFAPFYVKEVNYDGSTTKVTIWPSPVVEVGSRSPGAGSSLQVTNISIAQEVDPEDPVPGNGPEGFWLLVEDSTSPEFRLQPADRGRLEIAFEGDLTRFARPAHILEVGGYPYFISSSVLTEDGRFTRVNLSNPTYTAHEPGSTVYVSVRPVLLPNPVDFVGVKEAYEDAEFLVFLLGSRNILGQEIPGKRLAEGVQYEVEEATGSVFFKTPTQDPLKPWERIQLSYVGEKVVGPTVIDGAVVAPTYKAVYIAITEPSEINGILGSTLIAKYSYANPDSFFMETLPFTDYLGEVAEIALTKSAPLSRSAGPAFAFPGQQDPSDQGAFGLRSDAQDKLDQDRAARAYIEFYNGVVASFEQILEAIDGRIIGDRDGKFRFFIGRGEKYPGPGYEDDISGNLIPRLIWRYIIDRWAPEDPTGLNGLSNEAWYEETDPVFDPTTAFEPGASSSPNPEPGSTDGTTPNSRNLDFYLEQQRTYIKNDMDDRLLVGFSRPRGLATLFPSIDVPGLFKGMWQAHAYSRIAPERVKHFTRLFPGLEAVFDAASGGFTDPGFYSPGRKLTLPGPEPGESTEQIVSTRGTPIGVVANRAQGKISNVVSITTRDRLPRARIWAYYPNGSQELDDALGTTTVGRAAIVATPLRLSEFPVVAGDTVNPERNGFPDATQLLGQGGSLFSLDSGDADLSTPAFEADQRLTFARPGVIYDLFDSSEKPVFVESVEASCVILIKDAYGNPVAGSGLYALTTKLLEEVVTDGTGRGDTIFVGPALPNVDDIPGDADPMTAEAVAALALANDYNMQKDLRIGRRSGDFIDNTFRTKEDVFKLNIQGFLGQNPPSPLTCIEGEVEVVRGENKPLQIPALKGEAADDSGDVPIPYIRGNQTELDILGDIAEAISALFGSDSPYAGALPLPPTFPLVEQQDWLAVYPNELPFQDGTIYETYQTSPDYDPATLYTEQDMRPVETAGSYAAESAIGDARRFDLLLVEADQPLVGSGDLNRSRTGILSVGEVQGFSSLTDKSSLEPPRFVTPAQIGDTHYYSLSAAFAYTDVSTLSGLEMTESIPANFLTDFDLTSIAGLILSDGPGSSSGGLLDLVPGPGANNNAIVIHIYSKNPLSSPSRLGAVVIPDKVAANTIYVWRESTSTSTPVTLAGFGAFLASEDLLRVETSTSILSLIPEITPGEYYDFKIDIDTWITSSTSALTGGALPAQSGNGSDTCGISRDRLTFTEKVSLQTTLPRGTFAQDGVTNISTALRVQRVDTPLGIASVNSPAEVNGGDPFTFLERVSGGTPYVGTFTPASAPAAGDEVGSLKVMAWEGHNNSPLPFVTSPMRGIIASAVPSSDLFTDPSLSPNPGVTGALLQGEGTIRDDVPDPLGINGFNTLEGTQNWIERVSASDGDLSYVVPGDIVCVSSGLSPTSPEEARVKTGTYLIRHSVAENAVAAGLEPFPLYASTASSQAGSHQYLDLRFPTLKSLTPVPATLFADVVLAGVRSIYGSPHGATATTAGCGFPDPAVTGSNGYLYFIIDDQYADYDSSTATYTRRSGAVVRVPYSSMSYDEELQEASFRILANGGVDATRASGGNYTAGELAALLIQGLKVSGMSRLPFYPNEETISDLPKNNILGMYIGGFSGAPPNPQLTAGFRSLTIANTLPANHTDSAGSATLTGRTWDKAASLLNIERMLNDADDPSGNIIGVRVPEGVDNTEFYLNRETTVYGRSYDSTGGLEDPIMGVPDHIHLGDLLTSGLLGADWDLIHFGAGATTFGNRLDCLLPGDQVVFSDSLSGGNPGFFALSGVFLEPSFPAPTQNLSGVLERVVADSYTATASQVGIRQAGDFIAGATEEKSTFVVRRIRRFHEVQTTISSNVEELKYVYEMRRGLFDSYDPATRVFTADTSAGPATTLGPFNDPDVNIRAGDILRVLDASGNLLDTAEVSGGVGTTSSTLKLRRPGLRPSKLTGATSFEIYLQQPIVPHEQSNQQLFDILVDETVLTRTVGYPSGGPPATDGGRVPLFNTLEDNLVASWANEGVQEGDYVIIDPAGPLYKEGEAGVRPIGDTSVNTGVPRPAFVSGSPTALDDNRGFYRVTAIDNARLEVSGACRFGGGSEDGSDNEVFGDSAAPSAEYALLPTVSASTLTGAGEGQQALRPTAAPVGTSFNARTGLDASKSIEPFGYKIVRTSSLFSQDATELILFLRERTLSWIEEIKGIYDTGRGGDYYTFQRDDHIRDLPSPTDPSAGAGVVTNLVLESLEGLVDEQPFANTSDCLSILDRRFFILDFRLDALPTGSAVFYTEFVTDDLSQRPVLPDLIEEVLNLEDRFRDQRFSWISFRADRSNGSIQEAERAIEELPEQIEKQKELAAQNRALDER